MSGPVSLGIDFGTSNSAAGICVDGVPRLVELEANELTLPTAVFFPEDGGPMRVGRAAVSALVDGEEGRFMRSLKSVLGTSLMHEERRVEGVRMTFVHIIGRFLDEIRQRCEDHTGLRFRAVVSGRPVHFHNADASRDKKAEEDLRACYLAAGFDDVRFMYEPEAALRATPSAPGLGLIVDIGGGTSDFTAFRRLDDGRAQILASNGVRIGGTDFDRRISLDHIMPQLGRGSMVRATMGNDRLPAPARIFADLATWQMIPFLYTPETRRLAKDLARYADEPDKLGRLVKVLEEELGHDLAFAAERAKIDVNGGESSAINLSLLQPGLRVPFAADDLNGSVNGAAQDIAACALETIDMAAHAPDDLQHLVLVGGSSLMTSVRGQMSAAFPNAKISAGQALTGIADGLALASGSGQEELHLT